MRATPAGKLFIPTQAWLGRSDQPQQEHQIFADPGPNLGEISIADVATCSFSATGCRAVEKHTRCIHALEYALWNLVSTTYEGRLAQRALAEFSPSAPAEFQVILKTRDLPRNLCDWMQSC